MCQSKAAGGRRCDYADMIANVRRKARYKHADEYNMERLAQEAVDSWKKENAEIVAAHLPEREIFQASPNRKPVPSHLLEQFSFNAKKPVKGLNTQDRENLILQLKQEHDSWTEQMNREQERDVVGYSIVSYDLLNRILRRSGLADYFRENKTFRQKDEQIEHSKLQITNIDSALSLVQPPEQPRKLYRYFKLPAGVSAEAYIQKYFITGEGFKDRGYLSSSADPDFVLAQVKQNQERDKTSQYIVLEILTKQGGSLQRDKETSVGHIQSFENEVLLPRNTKMRIVGANPKKLFEFADDRQDLYQQFVQRQNGMYYQSAQQTNEWFQKKNKFRKGDRHHLPVVQMVDERLISEG
jgi:ADP-ribosyltransferase exoenzyme